MVVSKGTQMELITVSQTIIGQGAVNAVNARELHAKLEVKTRFDMWVQRAIEKYGFELETDFCTNLSGSTGGRPSTEYIVSLDMAKELCMLDDSAKGLSTNMALNMGLIIRLSELAAATMLLLTTLSLLKI